MSKKVTKARLSGLLDLLVSHYENLLENVENVPYQVLQGIQKLLLDNEITADLTEVPTTGTIQGRLKELVADSKVA